jgi:transposase
MITVGIDISKSKFDIFYQEKSGKKISKVFKNNLAGFEAMFKLIPNSDRIRVIMEATGNYGDDLANYSYLQKATVHVVNPAQIKFFGQSKLRRSKTDKVDAKLIYEFGCVNNELRPWQPMSPNLFIFRSLHRCLQNLKLDLVQFGNRLESEKDISVIAVYNTIITTLNLQIKELIEKIRSLVSDDQNLQQMTELMTTIPGVGELTSWGILSEVDITQFNNARQLAAYAGLNPHIRQSGSSVKGRGAISKIGSSQLRKALYFPAMSALKHNHIIREFGDRLKTQGKAGKVVIVAAMHKLLRMIFAILKSGVQFRDVATSYT